MRDDSFLGSPQGSGSFICGSAHSHAKVSSEHISEPVLTTTRDIAPVMSDEFMTAPTQKRQAAAPVGDFSEEAEILFIASKELLSAIRNIFAGDDAALRRLSRSLRFLNEVSRSFEDQNFTRRSTRATTEKRQRLPFALEESLEKAVRDTEAALAFAEDEDFQGAAKKAYESHCHLEEILRMLP